VKTSDPRQLAVDVLQRRQKATVYTEELLGQALEAQDLAANDRGLAQELIYGTVRWQATLDWLIARKTQGRPQSPALQILLRLALYQLFWLERIPDHAAVHQTVELAKRLGLAAKAGFLNAVLRGYLREREQTERALEDLRQTEPAAGYSHPQWLFERWESRWGRDKAIALMVWNNRPASTYARVNLLKTNPAALLQAWQSEGVSALPVQRPWLEDGQLFELGAHPRLSSLPSFERGDFYVQDPSTLLAVRQMEPRPGERVLDLCAAPGGKTTYIAQLMENRGSIVAQDLEPQRLEMIRHNCQRLGAACEVSLAPGSDAPLPASFDRVLLDAPCSNTGVMRRRIDLRWRIRPQEISRLQNAQLDLLRKAALQVKPGGALVYSTCSVERDENQEVVQRFLREDPAFQLEAEHELLPFIDAVDGAYVARFGRIDGQSDHHGTSPGS
jgi:16S rRNA (cytosine967-C5)-methyltransferase